MDLTTLQNVKDYLGVPIASQADDLFLAALISRASALCEKYCDRVLGQATYTDEEYDGRDSDSIWLKQYPVASVANVKIDGSLLAASDYVLYKDQGRIRKKSGNFAGSNIDSAGVLSDARAPGVRNVTVTYTAGYATIPLDLEQAVIELVKRKYQHRQKGDENIVSRTLPGGESVSYSVADLLPETKMVLDMYRRRETV